MTRETLIVVAVVAAGVALYVFECWWFPFRRCGCCKGKSIHLREDGKVFRTCAGWRCWPRGCSGTGKKLRVGRRVYLVLRRLVTDAT